jgi:ATP-dependent DNA ligase
MEARTVAELPAGAGWQFEPKWDGFRCLAFRDGDAVRLQSKSGKPLTRYFPEVEAAVRALRAPGCVLDGEVVVPVGDRLSFDDLLQRIHPAASRIARLARETPALYVLFDLLVDDAGTALVERPLRERRAALEAFAGRYLADLPALRLSPATESRAQAARWFAAAGKALDGVIAKRLDAPYASGERDGMVKLKPSKTADCVIGGFRYGKGSKDVASLLLGLYADDGLLHHVGFTTTITREERRALTRRLEAMREPPGFTGNAPGGPSRWSTERSADWQPLRPELVVEVAYDQVAQGRFRHGTRLVRWRPDKAPQQCRMDQIEAGGRGYAALLRGPKQPRGA